MAEVARAYVTIVPVMQGAQAEITKELTGITDTASKEAGESGGSSFGGGFASALKGTAAVVTASLVAVTTAAVASATAAGKAFISAAKDTAAYGDEVDKNSQRLGVSRQAYQELDYVLNLAGTNMSSMNTGFKTLTNQIDAATTGSSDALVKFEALGLSMEDLSTMSREDIFKAVVTGFQDMEDSASRAALANDLFGRSGQNLAPLFNMTSDATREAIETANEYGMVLSDEGVAASAQFTDSMATMDKTVQGLKNQMMANFLPSMSTIMDGISAIFAGDKMGVDLIQQGITDLIAQIGTYAPIFFQLAETILMALLNGFAPMMPDAVTMIFSFLTTALTTISGMIPQLLPVITSGIQALMSTVFECLPIIIQSLVQLTGDLVGWLSSGNNVKMLADGLIQLVGVLAQGIGDLLPILLPAIIKIEAQIAEALIEPQNMKLILDSILYLIGAIVVALSEWLVAVIDTVVDFIGKIKDNTQKAWADLIAKAKTFFSNVFSTAKSWLTTIKDTVVNWISGVISKVVGFFTNLKSSVASIFTHIADSVSNIKTKVGNLVTGIIGVLKDLPSKVVSIGKDLVTGLWNGISDKVEWVKNKIKGMGSAITSAIKNVFGIHSPSRIWRDEIGSMLALGLGEGFTEEMDDVAKDMTESMTGLTGSMTAEVTGYDSRSAMAPAVSSSTLNGSPITINVYGAEGQDVNSLAQTIAQKLEDMTRRKEVVYA